MTAVNPALLHAAYRCVHRVHQPTETAWRLLTLPCCMRHVDVSTVQRQLYQVWSDTATKMDDPAKTAQRLSEQIIAVMPITVCAHASNSMR